MGCVNIDATGGCLKATINRVGVGLSAAIKPVDEHLKATIDKVGSSISATISTINEPLMASVGRVGCNLKVSVGLICTPNTDIYLRVEPEMLWLANQGDSLDVNVISNIRWTVK